jgi:glycosyltransferase involved in cell wall biosynthesis
MLDVTVYILSYNRLAYLREAVASVLAQTHQPTKIAVYDNGSDPRVYAGMKEFLERGVHWIGAEKNHPFIWNFSRALADSQTTYTLLLHDDDRLCPDFLAVQTQLLDSSVAIAAASSNGYFIDENGERNGETLAQTKGNAVEMLVCSGHIAMKYAENSCVPFSSTIYRSEIARSVKFREEFGKVADAVYFCDLADIGYIAYQTRPLYESRLHAGQDSQSFPYDLMNQLERFFETRTGLNNMEQVRLRALLVRQHTARNIKRALDLLKKWHLSMAFEMMRDERFRFVDAVALLVGRLTKFVASKAK